AEAERSRLLAGAVRRMGPRALRGARGEEEVGRGRDQQMGWGMLKLSAAVMALLIASAVVARSAPPAEPLWDTGTFSILGFDPATGEVGGAVQSRVFSVGNGVLWADADAGVAATQAIVDVGYGPRALDLLRKHMKPAAII